MRTKVVSAMVTGRVLLRWIGLALFCLVSLAARAEVVGVVFQEDFEAGWGDWSADLGVWEVGSPTAGPPACDLPGFATGIPGTQCAGTVLAGNYPADTDSSLISAPIQLPAVSGGEDLQLRFWHWFSYAVCDAGYVQVSAQDPSTGTWGPWTTIKIHPVNDAAVSGVSTPAWWRMSADLTPYAGKKIKLGFYHDARYCGYGNNDSSFGWYVDNVQIIKNVPSFSGDFELGWEDWYTSQGVWEIGTPKEGVGPGKCYSGTQCAGTVLAGNYPADTDSSLISAPIQLPAVSGGEDLQLRFWHWFSYAVCDAGYVQVSAQDPSTGTWGPWTTVGNGFSGVSAVWSPVAPRDLTPYAGKKIKLGFYHDARYCGYGNNDSSFGWYVDNIEFVILGGSNHPPVMSPIADQAVAEGGSLVVPVSATDADGNPLTLSVAGLLSFATFTDNGNGTGSIAFTPGPGTVGKYVLRVTASDGSLGRLSSSDVFTLTVCTAAGDLDCDTIPDTADNCTLVPNENQRDTNNDGYGNICDPDLNNNGVVNFADLAIIKLVFFTANPDADLNGDGVVNFGDLAIMKSMFFKAPGPSGIALRPLFK